ncbi:MAG: 5-formyltetrahydrofolate cyclo-ligase [Planctomycetota bacterium]|nr:5-formyltetrahydrofolate cyclo-ligase [Planctomycetota bacterium]
MTSSGHDFEELARMATSAEAADVRRAHELAVGGMRADARLGLVAATAYDRLRVFDGRPQKFGTHAIAERGDLVAWPVDPATTDTERAKWGVGKLQHLLERAAAGPVVDKQLLRQAVRRRRASIADDARAPAAGALRAAGLAALGEGCAGAVVAAYWPLASEIDPRPLARALRDDFGARLALPSVDGDQLWFGAWGEDAELQPAGFGALGPAHGAEQLRPDVVLAPLVACDRRGGRLGQGKGYYDRALSQLDVDGGAYVVGVAFDCQLSPAVPTEAHDRRLDAVLTDREWIALSS